MSAQEFKVGQQVSGDDYARLPVGARAQYERASAPIVKVAADRWVYRGEGVTDPSTCPRTLTHLPDAAEPEDKDDLYVEPEPLKEGDHVLVWAKVERDVSAGAFNLSVQRHPKAVARIHVPTVYSDAIVRPEAGQVPPWVKPAQCTSLKATGRTTLHRCEGEEGHGGDHVVGWVAWTDAEAYGRVEVSA